MPPDFSHRARSQFTTRRNFMPGRSARGMRQRDQIKPMTDSFYTKLAANHGLQLFAVDELPDG